MCIYACVRVYVYTCVSVCVYDCSKLVELSRIPVVCFISSLSPYHIFDDKQGEPPKKKTSESHRNQDTGVVSSMVE